MSKIQYFFAAIYQKLLDIMPNGTPYLNLKLGIIFNLFLHYSEIAFYLKNRKDIFLFPDSKSLSVTLVIAVSVTIYFILSGLIPLDVIGDIEVPEKQKKLYYNIFFGYMTLNIGFLFYLLVLTLPHQSS